MESKQSLSIQRNAVHESCVPVVWRPAVVLVAVVGATFAASLANDWVNIDDPLNIHLNKPLRGEEGHPLLWPWTSFTASLYRPLAWYYAMWQFAMGGVLPYWFHAGSIIAHEGTTVALYFLCVTVIRLAAPQASETTARWAAAWSAALFALHPLRVEAVAWFSAQPYVLCGFFAVMATRSYLLWRSAADRRQRALAWTFYLSALLSQPVAVTIPFVWLVLDWTPLRRGAPWNLAASSGRALWFEKIPMFFFAAVFMALAVAAKAANESLEFRVEMTLEARIAQAAHGLIFYLQQTFWPSDLIAFYHRPPGLGLTAGRFPFDAFLVVALTLTFVGWRRQAPGLLAAWAAYTAILAPNLGLVQIGDYVAADRYAYLSFLPWAVVGAVALAQMSTRFESSFAWRFDRAAAAVAILLAWFTWQQIGTWRNSLALWEHAVRHGGARSSVVRAGYGMALYRDRQTKKAVDELRRAAALPDVSASTRLTFAQLAASEGGVHEAIEQATVVASEFPHSRGAANILIELLGPATDRRRVDPHTVTVARAALRAALERQGRGADVANLAP